MAAGGFITRALESMLKECSNKKYSALQIAIQSYIDNSKTSSQQSSSIEIDATTSSAVDQSSTDTGASKNEAAPVDSATASPSGEGTEQISGPASQSETIVMALAQAGNTLSQAQAGIVLNPLRLAFETKNGKIMELALDCLHKLIAYDHLEGDLGLDGGENVALFTDILNRVCGCVDNLSPDSTTLQVLKVLLTAVASTKFRVHGESLLGVIRVCYNIALNSKSPINQATSKAMLTQMLSIVFRRMENDLAKDTSVASVEELQSFVGGADIKGLEAALEKVVHLKDGEKVTRGVELERMSPGEHDAFLLFRTLCKMGIEEDNDEVTVKTRILSLELLQGLLEGVSDSFTKNFQFMDSVKAYLSYVLLRASVSQSPTIFQYATGIFSVLLLQFRECLKDEIGIFFPLVVLRPLDGTDLNAKTSIPRMLEKVCKNSQMLVDLYVNYDCDPQAPNLFERMVTTLSKIAQGTQNAEPNSVATSQIVSIKASSLQCLVNVLKSLVEWEKSWSESDRMSNRSLSSEEETLKGDHHKMRDMDGLPSNFDKLKAHKSTVEVATSEFKRKPMKGIEYLISNGLVENSPTSVAQFLKSTPSLDKTMIGDYLGQHEEFPVAVMHAYVDSMNFSGMKFDLAIRQFLKGFRLPGEAQKIDRIIEKFSERYCADNPGLFKKADTAYILAYAVIMLNTDAHNPMVWPKMSKDDFICMNATDEAEDCAPTELLEEIYDSIVKEEIKMKDDPVDLIKSSKQKPEAEERGHLVNILNLALPRRRSSTDPKSESEVIIKQTQAIFRNQGGKRGVFYTSHNIKLVRPMIEALGWPLLATLAVLMEEGDNKARVGVCMEGFKAGIHITHVLGMDTMRYAFLTTLLRLNLLHVPRDMKSKNVEALRTLLAICDSDAEALQDTWIAVLECISRLEFIVTNPSMAATVMQGSNQISRDSLLQSLRELTGKPTEQVFVNSVKLPSESVVEFFSGLCKVSAEELRQYPVRVFSLQKLVEISYYNMARIRMVWARIWSVLATHFIFAGSHPEEKVAMYAIDSLRQLGMKYLERAELANFSFQNDILKPFVVLMRSSRSETIRRLIVDCIVQMIKSKLGSIKSGWRSVFMIFTAAADDELEQIVESAFENVEQVILEHFDQVVGDCFMDCVNCLIRFANNKTSHRISLKAIALLRICEDRLAEGFIPGGALKPVDTTEDVTCDITEHFWFPMLAGLSDLTSDPRPEVRSCALEVLFDLLNERGGKFSSTFWENIFHRVLFPIFDHVRHAGKENLSSTDEWPRESSIHSLQLLCNLFNTFYKNVCFMLPPLLGLLLDCAQKSDQAVVAISLGALVHLIEVGGHQFSYNDWETLLESIRNASYATQPLELLNDLGFENSKHHTALHNVAENGNGGDHSSDVLDDTHGSERSVDLEETGARGKDEDENSMLAIIRSKCVTQLLLLSAIDSIQKKYWNKLKPTHKITIMDILFSVLEFAASYNSYSNLRLRMRQIPAERPPFNLLRVELAGTSIYLDILHKTTSGINSVREESTETTVAQSGNSYMNNDAASNDKFQQRGSIKEDKFQQIAEEKLVSFCGQVLKEASEFQSCTAERANMDLHRVLELRSPIIVKVLRGMCSMNSQIFRSRLREFYPLITKLVCCDQMDVRGSLADLFNMQLNPLLA
ncbi:unnamed protein product [Withania somnifera]